MSEAANEVYKKYHEDVLKNWKTSKGIKIEVEATLAKMKRSLEKKLSKQVAVADLEFSPWFHDEVSNLFSLSTLL